MTEKDLKRCPFCGGKASVCQQGYANWYWVTCEKCGAKTGSRAKKATAIKNWEKRHE